MIKQAKVLKKLRSGLKEYKANLTGSKVDEARKLESVARKSSKHWDGMNAIDRKNYNQALKANESAKALGKKAPHSYENLTDLLNKRIRSTQIKNDKEWALWGAERASSKAVKSRDKTRKMTGAAATVAGGLTLRALLRGYKASKSNRLIEKLKRNKGKAALGGFGTVGIADLALENRRKRKKLEASKSRNKKK